MGLFATIGIALGLAMDAFAVAIATSMVLRSVSPRQVFRLAFHVGLFQAMMPVIGWWAGRFVGAQILAWDHWVAFGLLAGVGTRAIHQAARPGRQEQRNEADPTRGLSLVILSIATSIDALAVGTTFGLLQVRIWYTVAIIGIVTCMLTVIGMIWGAYLGARLGRFVEILGGLVLIAIGITIVIRHTLM